MEYFFKCQYCDEYDDYLSVDTPTRNVNNELGVFIEITDTSFDMVNDEYVTSVFFTKDKLLKLIEALQERVKDIERESIAIGDKVHFKREPMPEYQTDFTILDIVYSDGAAYAKVGWDTDKSFDVLYLLDKFIKVVDNG